MSAKLRSFSQFLCVVLVLLIALPLLGCQSSDPGSLSGAKEMEISAAWEEKTGHGISWGGCIYYGTYRNCVVWFESGQAQAVTRKNIAGHEFVYQVSFALHVYRNGEFMYLEDAYENGFISRSQVKKIWKYHKSLNPEWYA